MNGSLFHRNCSVVVIWSALFTSLVRGQEFILTLVDGPPGQINQVLRLDNSGHPLGALNTHGLAYIAAADHRGNAFLSNFGEVAIHKFDHAGDLVGAISAPNSVSVGFPNRLAARSTGELVVLYGYSAARPVSTIQRFDGDGQYLGEITSSVGQSGFRGIAFDRIGNVATTQANSVRKYATDGQLLQSAIWSSTPLGGVLDLTFDELGNLFVLTREAIPYPSLARSQIYRVDAMGVQHGIIAQTQAPDIWTSIEAGVDGVLYVAGGPDDFSSMGYLKKYDAEGTFLGHLATGLPGTASDFAIGYPTPEPASMCMFALGACWLCVERFRSRTVQPSP